MAKRGVLFFLLVLLAARGAVASGVVINEIMYHPPSDLDDLQYVELHNAGAAAVDLSGWRLTKGIRFAFTNGTVMDAGGYLVVARRLRHFAAQYGSNLPAIGDFDGKLSHSGEEIELADAQGRVEDRVAYSDHAPWPTGPDGCSASLERICASVSGAVPENWDGSPLPRTELPSGTPGRRNHASQDHLPPVIRVKPAASPRPDQPTSIQAEVNSPTTEVRNVSLFYAVAINGRLQPERETAMRRASGDTRAAVYLADIPAQPEGALVRYRVTAADTAGGVRSQPSTNSPCPTFSFSTLINTNRSQVGFVYVWNFERAPREGRFNGPNGVPVPADPCRGNGVFIHAPTNAGELAVFDHVYIPPRDGGWKVHFNRDRHFNEMSALNLIFEGPPRQALSEALSFDLFNRCGVSAPEAGHVRVWLDGRCLGYQLLVEQPNQHFLSRHGRDTSGHLYKLNWMGRNLVAQHEKKTRLESGHADLVETVSKLNALRGAAQWEYIRTHFNVDEFATYFAVNMCIQNWDGFWNNHYVYHDTGRTGKWELYPWDEDKTWGDFDGVSPNYDWYTMPLHFGMNDSGPEGFNPFDGAQRRRRDFGGATWWRRPGHFSGPLLANPEFRRRFLDRLEVICRQEFTEECMRPIIDALEQRLQGEVEFRAALRGRDSAPALDEFRRHIQSLRNQVKHRREFILNELPKERAQVGRGAPSRAVGLAWQTLWFSLGLAPLAVLLGLALLLGRRRPQAHRLPPRLPSRWQPGTGLPAPPVIRPPSPPVLPPS